MKKAHTESCKITDRILVVGGSAGSLKPLQNILNQLPQSFCWPIVIVIHSAGDSSLQLPGVRQRKVLEAVDKMAIKPGLTCLAPADYHLFIERDNRLSLSLDERLHYCRPAIDYLFSSAAKVWGKRSIGLLLSGANEDGAAGLLNIKNQGGEALVQSPQTADISTMPQAAIDIGAATFVGDETAIIERLKALMLA